MVLEMLWIPPAVAGCYVWWRIAQGIRPEPDDVVPSSAYRIGDGIFASILALYFILGILAPDPESRVVDVDLLITGIVLYAVMTLFVYAFLTVRGLNVVQQFGLNRTNARDTFLAAIVGIVCIYPTILVLTWVSRMVIGDGAGDDATIEFLRSKPEWTALAIAGLLVVVVAPIAEEFIFRGLLYGVAKRFGGRIPACIATSMLFSAIHLNPVAIVPLFVLSVIFTLAYERSGSLWTPIVMHMLFNGGQFLVLLFFPEWMQ